MKVHQEAGLSPLSSTKGNKSRNKVKNKSIRVNPKRSGKQPLNGGEGIILECEVC